MRRIIKKISLWLLVCFSLLGGGPVKAQEADTLPNINAEAAMLIDRHNGQILFEETSDRVVEVGSLSKLLSLYIIYEAIAEGELALDDEVAVSEEAYHLSQDYNLSNVPLRQDLTYSVEELIEAVAITSANGAMLALSEHLAGDEASFVDMMNKQLSQWGDEGSEIYNVTGLPEGNESHGKVNKMSAKSLATTAYHLLDLEPELLKIMSKEDGYFRTGSDDDFKMLNMNDMLETGEHSYEGMEGMAVGQSERSGLSFVGAASKNNLDLISVVLGAKDEEVYNSTKKLLDYGFASYVLENVARKGDPVTQVAQVEIEQGRTPAANLVYGNDLSLVLPMIDIAPRMQYEFVPNADTTNASGQLVAPLEAGQQAGEVIITGEGQKIEHLDAARGNRVKVVLAEDVPRAPWYLRAWRSFRQGFQTAWRRIRQFFLQVFN